MDATAMHEAPRPAALVVDTEAAVVAAANALDAAYAAYQDAERTLRVVETAERRRIGFLSAAEAVGARMALAAIGRELGCDHWPSVRYYVRGTEAGEARVRATAEAVMDATRRRQVASAAFAEASARHTEATALAEAQRVAAANAAIERESAAMAVWDDEVPFSEEPATSTGRMAA